MAAAFSSTLGKSRKIDIAIVDNESHMLDIKCGIECPLYNLLLAAPHKCSLYQTTIRLILCRNNSIIKEATEIIIQQYLSRGKRLNISSPFYWTFKSLDSRTSKISPPYMKYIIFPPYVMKMNNKFD